MDLAFPQRLQQSAQGSFHKTALLQERVREFIWGASPLVETRESNPIKIAYLEMERGLIELIPAEESDQPPPPPSDPSPADAAPSGAAPRRDVHGMGRGVRGQLAQRTGLVEFLRGAGALFGVGAQAREALYDQGPLRAHWVFAPVVGVGNLSVGGTGKTPMIAWLARPLAGLGFRPGIVSRSYGAGTDGAPNDEALMLRSRPQDEHPAALPHGSVT